MAVLLLGAPTPACAKRHIVEPGDPGSSQYQEDVPTASGGRPVSTLQPSSTASSTILPRAAVHALSRDGTAGRSTVALAQATAPGTPPTSPSHKARVQPLGYRAAGAVGVLASSLLGSGAGMGVWLPIMLVLMLAAAVAVAVERRR